MYTRTSSRSNARLRNNSPTKNISDAFATLEAEPEAQENAERELSNVLQRPRRHHQPAPDAPSESDGNSETWCTNPLCALILIGLIVTGIVLAVHFTKHPQNKPEGSQTPSRLHIRSFNQKLLYNENTALPTLSEIRSSIRRAGLEHVLPNLRQNEKVFRLMNVWYFAGRHDPRTVPSREIWSKGRDFPGPQELLLGDVAAKKEPIFLTEEEMIGLNLLCDNQDKYNVPHDLAMCGTIRQMWYSGKDLKRGAMRQMLDNEMDEFAAGN
ncbi:hypothetical protein N431DRAFT_447263 [Stipitochalara longipes BDJ]|nr:hypothetical protein N431DRAFT_447263 [Stipitochalara longipes BDJ]